MSEKLEIVDSRPDHLDLQPENTVEVLQTIVPYFPDNEQMSRYLCYVASGWTRNQALIRAGAKPTDYQQWLLDNRFREIDTLPYNDLRERVANAYAELKIRRNTIQWLEFDEELLQEVQRKIAMKEELTKDERAIFLKRASTYGPETLQVANKIMSNRSSDEEEGQGVFDIVALVKARMIR